MATTATWIGIPEQENNVVTKYLCFTLISYGSNIYVGIHVPAAVIKIDTATMIRTATWSRASWEGEGRDLTFDDTNIYYTLEITPMQVVKIDPSTMTGVATWVGEMDQKEGRSVTYDGTYIYAGTSLATTQVIKIDPATMTTDGVWVGAAGQDYCQDLTSDGEYIYAGFHVHPAHPSLWWNAMLSGVGDSPAAG